MRSSCLDTIPEDRESFELLSAIWRGLRSSLRASKVFGCVSENGRIVPPIHLSRRGSRHSLADEDDTLKRLDGNVNDVLSSRKGQMELVMQEN